MELVDTRDLKSLEGNFVPVQVQLWAPYFKMLLENKISVILPAFDDAHHLKAQINSINNQSLKPSEIILVDSSSNNLIEDTISSISSDVPVKYYRIGRGFRMIDTCLNYQKFLPF